MCLLGIIGFYVFERLVSILRDLSHEHAHEDDSTVSTTKAFQGNVAKTSVCFFKLHRVFLSHFFERCMICGFLSIKEWLSISVAALAFISGSVK